MINEERYRTDAEYRRVVDELRHVTQELGALQAAYGNAISDQQRMKDELHKRGGWDDDPGRGGSGGQY